MTFRIICYIIGIIFMIIVIIELIAINNYEKRLMKKWTDKSDKKINKLEISDGGQVSRSGTFISEETFKRCFKESAPVPVTFNGEEIGRIVMRNATAEENEGIYNYIKCISEPLYTKDDMIKRLEKVKEEMYDVLESDVVQCDYWGTLIKNKAHIFISVVDNNISELKGDNNESADK